MAYQKNLLEPAQAQSSEDAEVLIQVTPELTES